LASFGEGTKKKLWMGLLDWERGASVPTSVLRAYDEPDVNLDYGAERKLFMGIVDSTRDPNARTQAIVCTHAITLVDRAPGSAIRLITVGDDGKRQIAHLEEDTDAEVERFLGTVGRTVGLSNSALFYERAFLIVEGESEENALPELYRHLFGRSLAEDGIVLINLHSAGAWKAILKVLQRHKADVTVLLLDEDCRKPESSARITADTLADIGYEASFIDTSCFYIGNKEFEDAFRDEDIVAVLNGYWPRADKTPWTHDHVVEIRQKGDKFSDQLMDCVRTTCAKERRQSARKPDFATRLGEHCSAPASIPAAIQSTFRAVRKCAGWEE
jgi:hypothetical protein